MADETCKRRRSRGGCLLRRLAGWLAIFLLAGAFLNVTGCMERLFYYPQAGPTPLPPGFEGEAITFRSGDGTRLHGWFIPARGPADSKPATVLHLHGNAGNITDHFGFTDFLPGAGFNLFIFDYRGYGQSEGSARRRDDLIADANAALDWLLARDDVDRVAMYAQSLGGALGLNLMADRSEIAAGVVVSPFTSWREIAADSVSRTSRPGPIARGLARVLISDHRRPDDAVARINRPVLLLHGDRDSIVPVEHGRRIAAAGPTVTFVELRGANHNDLRAVSPDFEARIIEFLRRNS